MAKAIDDKFAECLKRGKIKLFPSATDLCEKELSVAEDDLEVAVNGLNDRRWKWCTIQAYYSMFHTARALLHDEGYREKSHYCLVIAVESLFVKTGRLPEKFIDAFQNAKVMRENADYNDEFSETGARKLVKIAEAFLAEAKKLIAKSE